MKKSLCLFFLFFSMAVTIRSQGIEVYGGYPFAIKSNTEKRTVNNWANGLLGGNVSVYVRAVCFRVGAGVMTNNYSIYGSEYRGNVKHGYVFIPITISARLYTNGKNTFSLGGGINTKIPLREKKSVVIDNYTPQNYYGFHTNTMAARVLFRYDRMLPNSFHFFTEVFSDVRFLRDFNDYHKPHPFPPPGYAWPVQMPYYESRVSVGLHVGVGYLLPVDGNKTPRYFQKREKSVKSS